MRSSIRWSAGLLLACLLLSRVAAGEEDRFAQCIAGLQEKAQQEQLPEWIVRDVIGELREQPRVIELDRRQPEFTRTFADYLYRRVTPERVERGRRLLKNYRPFLDTLTKQYGVPGRYLVAFWGLETNYGSYLGRMPTLDSLATLACDPRRSSFFTDELLIALRLLERESLTPGDMRGSWAGAVGHTQFMPSAYSRYAVDGDGDGRIDLWESKRDALASGANFLAGLGWQKGERWGREVLLPEDFPYAQSGLANKMPLSHWARLGVVMTNGGRLPQEDIAAAVLVPSGHNGPAFLVYENFEVIMRWNRSLSYALSVGHLADRIAGGGGLANPPPVDEPALSMDTIEAMQRRLNELGFDAGEADGLIGPATRAALRAFQKSVGFIADGYPDSETLGALEIDFERTS